MRWFCYEVSLCGNYVKIYVTLLRDDTSVGLDRLSMYSCCMLHIIPHVLCKTNNVCTSAASIYNTHHNVPLKF